MISIFELFSIGIGPSSSHTVGPMRAAHDFIQNNFSADIQRIKITLYGSLAYTGKGHGTIKAILLGLEGSLPESINPAIISKRMEVIQQSHQINLQNKQTIAFSFNDDITFNYDETFDYHSNTMRFQTFNASGDELSNEIYFSIGGGFIINNRDINKKNEPSLDVKFPFSSAADLLKLCEENNCSIASIIFENEKKWRNANEIREQIHRIAAVMEQCIKDGCETEGHLEGRLNIKRRAPHLYRTLIEKTGQPKVNHYLAMDWLNVYAIAANEENAAGGRIVTAPTNGAAGIIPAVLNYYKYFCQGATLQGIVDFMLTAGAIGILYKMNASISGAEMGCQGEVGVACSMAAGALTAALGGSIHHVENAAEIGMEHNLGLTCDPIDGLVQIPCIERNAMGAVKAVNASRLALAGEGEHHVSLDAVINTMREIGENMNSIYKETSKGGLAVNVTEC